MICQCSALQFLFRLSITVTIATLLQGCVQNAPKIEGLSLGVPGKGTILRKLIVSESFTLSNGNLPPAAGEVAALATATRVGVIDPLSDFMISAARATATGISASVDSDLSGLRCIYEVEVDDQSIAQSIRSNIFFGSNLGGNDGNGFGGDDGEIILPNGDSIQEADATPEQLAEWEEFKAEQLPSENSTTKKSRSITVPQRCIHNLEKGTKVFISYHSWGATLHQLVE